MTSSRTVLPRPGSPQFHDRGLQCGFVSSSDAGAATVGSGPNRNRAAPSKFRDGTTRTRTRARPFVPAEGLPSVADRTRSTGTAFYVGLVLRSITGTINQIVHHHRTDGGKDWTAPRG